MLQRVLDDLASGREHIGEDPPIEDPSGGRSNDIAGLAYSPAGGLYVVEDTHSSYHPKWGGGLRRPGSFIEQAKALVDQLHAWYGPIPGLEPDYVTQTAHGVHFYDSMVVIEKRHRKQPQPVYRGAPSMPLSPAEEELLRHMDRLARGG